MKKEIYRAMLSIDEPWDQSCVISGVIEKITLFETFGLSFIGEHGKNIFFQKDIRIVIEDVWKGDELIVNILEISDSTELSAESIEKGKIFSGIGSIKTIDRQ